MPKKVEKENVETKKVSTRKTQTKKVTAKENPTFEELTSQIEDIKLQIRNLEQQNKQPIQEKSERPTFDGDYGEEYVKRKKKKYFSKQELNSMGLKSKVVPVETKFVKYLSKEEKAVFKATTRPHVLSSSIKVLVWSVLMILGIILCASSLGSSNSLEDNIIWVFGIFLIAVVCSFFQFKAGKVLEGYNAVMGDIDNWLDWVALILNIVGLIASFPMTMILSMAKGSKKFKYSLMPRLAVPVNFNFDEIIEYGDSMDSWMSVTAELDRAQYYTKADVNNIVDNYVKSQESQKLGATVEEQEELNANIADAYEQRDKLLEEMPEDDEE